MKPPVSLPCSIRRSVLTLLLASATLGVPAATAQLGQALSKPASTDSSGGTRQTEQMVVEPGSPRQSIEAFYTLTSKNDYARAARYLDLPPGTDSLRAAELAEHLRAVLDRYLWVNLDELSPATGGDTDDGLAPRYEQIGVLPRRNGLFEPVRLVQRDDSASTWWAFTRSTVSRIDVWYGQLEDRWIRNLVPEPLRRVGPLRVQWWQWLALIALVPLLIGVGGLVGRVISAILGLVARRTANSWDNQLLTLLHGPLFMLCTVLLLTPATNQLGLNIEVAGFIGNLVRAGLVVVSFWALLRIVTLIERHTLTQTWSRGQAEIYSLVPLGAQLARLMLVLLGIIAMLAQFDYPVGTLLAGLGIGGIAVALAAQKTLENLIGSVAIGIDKPFRVGDAVKIDDLEGTIEEVGLRSTRIRTAERSLVSIPNGKLADMRTESFASRDRFRFSATIGLVHATTAAQLEGVVAGIEAWFRAQPKIWKDTMYARFVGLGDSALNIEIMAWLVTTDAAEFRDLRQSALLAIMRLVEENGTSFAFPTRTVEMADGREAMEEVSGGEG